MKTALVAAILATMLLAITAQAAIDPRKCASSGGHISAGPVVDGPTFCAYQAAQLAFRRYMTAVSHATVIYSAPMTCTQGTTNLVWTCDFGAGKGTITFKALSSGWHTRVAVTCGDPVMKPATSCH